MGVTKKQPPWKTITPAVVPVVAPVVVPPPAKVKIPKTNRFFHTKAKVNPLIAAPTVAKVIDKQPTKNDVAKVEKLPMADKDDVLECGWTQYATLTEIGEFVFCPFSEVAVLWNNRNFSGGEFGGFCAGLFCLPVCCTTCNPFMACIGIKIRGALYNKTNCFFDGVQYFVCPALSAMRDRVALDLLYDKTENTQVEWVKA